MGILRRLVAAFDEGFFPGRRLGKMLRNVPHTKLANVAESTFTRVSGVVRPFEERLLQAPLSQRPCIYYSLRVVSVERSVARAYRTELASEQDGIAFVLEDDTARALIDPVHARVSAAFDYECQSKAAFDADPRQLAVLQRLALIRRDWFNTDRLLFHEAVIEADDRIAVAGVAVREPDPEAAPTGMYRDARPLRLRFTGSARYPLLISDDPRTLT